MTEHGDEMDPGRLLSALKDEVMGLTRYWNTFLDLYGESEERVEFLRSVGQDFFETIQYALRDAVVMGIARLMDRPDMGRHKNASLGRLVDSLDETKDQTVIDESERLLNKIRSLAEPIAELRNKRIGHNDVDTVQEHKGIPPVLMRDVDSCIESMQDLLNIVSNALVGHTTDYDDIQPGSADVVLGYLKRGVEAEQR